MFSIGRFLRWVYLARLTLAAGIFAAALLVWTQPGVRPEATRLATVLLVLTLAVTLVSVWHSEIARRSLGEVFLFLQALFDVALVTAIGILMILSQLGSLTGGALEGADGLWSGIPVLTAVVTLAGIRLTPRYFPQLPGVIGGFLAGIACFHLLALIMPGPLPATWVVGEIPPLHGTVRVSELAALQRLDQSGEQEAARRILESVVKTVTGQLR